MPLGLLFLLFIFNFNRNDCIISLGGGITGDVSGFAASIYKRGIKFINIPTTLLAQVDSSIGGKTGINNNFGKNLVGSFYPPDLVITDTIFLNSLPKKLNRLYFVKLSGKFKLNNKSKKRNGFDPVTHIDKALELFLRIHGKMHLKK